MDEPRFALLLDACQSDPRCNVLQAPKVTLFNGQSATICDLVQRPFVTGVQPVRGDGAIAFQPVIEVVDEGWTIRMHAEVTEDEGIELSCGLCESHIEDVQLADLPPTVSMGVDEGITIQVPNVHCKMTTARSVLSAGETLCIVSPQPYYADDQQSKKIAQVYAIRPILIPESETLQAFTPGDEGQ